MDTIANYAILEQVAETKHSIVYRGRKQGNAETAIIKVLNAEDPSPSEVARFKQEYELIQRIDLEGVVKTFGITEHQGRFAIIFEDFDCVTVKQAGQQNAFDLQRFLETAIQISNTLGHLHQQDVVHRDINPQNLLINLTTRQVKIADFGISSILTKESEKVYHPEVIEGTLPYISPEQTGRMNRAVDYRTDLYSLGATLYQLLTDQVPFLADDPLEIIHSHIAVKPVPPAQKNPDIPDVVSDIVMKLMAKTPDERYNSAFGLKADFQECLNQLLKNKTIDRFEPGRFDASPKLNPPQKLYGREKEIAVLLDTFERVSQHDEETSGSGACEVIMVSGHPGIGKSALIQEIHKSIVAKKGYFISGKYEQIRREVPYSAIIQAFKELTRQLLTETTEMIDQWKKRISQALAKNGKVITDILDDLELIIGPQPDVPVLESKEAQNRLMTFFEKFIRVFATADHPLVIFLDDLQWADTPSLELMQILMTNPDTSDLLLIGSYRDNEVDSTHPLVNMIDFIRKRGVGLNELSLRPLLVADVGHFLNDSLLSNDDKTQPLAQLVHQKTNGNPFFVRQFLQTLVSEGQITFNPEKGWVWDIDAVNALQVTENVVELMAGKIEKLSDHTVELLKVCACVGNQFNLETLSILLNQSIENVLANITEAIHDGLIEQKRDYYKFPHDRIQEAAYSLISEKRKVDLHYTIGKLTYDNTSPAEMEKKIFYIVNQLNHGSGRITTKEEQDQLADFNLWAGRKARASAAYLPALQFYLKGIDLLQGWEEDYERSVQMHSEATECARYTGDFELMDSLASDVLNHSKNVLDSISVYKAKILALIAQGELNGGTELAVNVLKQLGVHMKTKVNQVDILIGLMKTKLALLFKDPEELYDKPDMTKPELLAAMTLLKTILAPTYLANPDMYPTVIFKMTQLSVKYGNAPESAIAYNVYGVVLCGILYDFETGYRFGQMGLKLIEKYNARHLQAMAYLLNYTFIHHWTHGLESIVEPLIKNAQTGYDTGDLEYAGYSFYVNAFVRFITGHLLADIEKDARKYSSLIEQTGQENVYRMIIITWQLVLNLQGKSDNPTVLTGEAMDEEERLLSNQQANDITALSNLYNCKLILNFLFEEHSIDIADQAEKHLEGSLSTGHYPLFSFFDSMTQLALYDSLDDNIKRKSVKRILKHRKDLTKWGFEEDCILIDAELARINGKDAAAANYYETAITAFEKRRYHYKAAIASELAAKFHLSKGSVRLASLFMRDARKAYQHWGAKAKVDHLNETYPQLLSAASSRHQGEISKEDTLTSSASTTQYDIDMATVIKASQAISGEIILEKLLDQVMRLLIQNAGAQRALLILKEEDRFLVEASGDIATDKIDVLQTLPVEESKACCHAIVQLVARTKELVLLNDATSASDFAGDPYIINNQPKSILCVPIVNQGKLTGIAYLENNLTTNAFTADGVRLLEILSSHAAIAIDNARLYANLEEKVEERTRELKQARDALWGEMELAAKIQTILLPDNPTVRNYQVSGYMQPADEVGGDYYDVINTEMADWVTIGDVSGHGVPAGLFMMMTQTAIQTAIEQSAGLNPDTLLSIVNKVVTRNIAKFGESKYMTITVLTIGKDGEICYSGLHQDIPVYRADSGKIEIVKTNGIWIGLEENISDLLTIERFSMKIDDVALLYTDGITEAIKNGSKMSMFGEMRLFDIFAKLAKAGNTTDDIKKGILKELKDYDCRDDITMVILKRER
ncbi:MAG: AAA family ATPase [Myxococcota bacterium]|nr:AAA family ATPase [Myxococcota bacterium]